METSESIALLAAALVKAQANIEPTPKDAENPFHKSHYSTLSALRDACRKPLSENGLSVIQTMERSEVVGFVSLRTTLLHESGEWIAAVLPMPYGDRATPQAVGSAITYARRYALGAMLGMSPCMDDDAEAAERPRRPAANQPQRQAVPRQATAPNPETQDGHGVFHPTKVEVASGVSKQSGKPWEKFKLHTTEGEVLASFSSTHKQVMETALEHKVPVEVRFRVGRYGKDIEEICLAEVVPDQQPPEDTQEVAPESLTAINVATVEETTYKSPGGQVSPCWVVKTDDLKRLGTFDPAIANILSGIAGKPNNGNAAMVQLKGTHITYVEKGPF